MKYAAMFACAAPFAALAGIVPGKDGPLVRSEDSKPVFLVSTTGKWSTLENKYVKSVALNGKMLDGFILRYEDIVSGGELVFEMAGKTDIQKVGSEK